MNTKTIVWVVAAIAVLVSAWYFLSAPSGLDNGSPSAAAPTQTVNVPTQQTPKKSPAPSAPQPTKTTAKLAGVDSLITLINLKQNLVCSVKTTSGSGRMGTAYVANGMARINFTNFTSASMIDDGVSLYIWADGAKTGLRLSAASGASGSAMLTNGGIDPATSNLSYACNPWTVDTSIFTPPASVSF